MPIYPYRKKQIVLYQGETTSNIYVVKRGIVRSFTTLSNGAEVIIGLYGPGDYFPSSVDATQLPIALFYYDMLAEGDIERVPSDDFYQGSERQQMQNKFFERRYNGALLHINALVQINAYEKLTHTMRYLSLRFGVSLNGKVFTRIDLKLTQQDIADLCNMSRETTNIHLNTLKSSNVVDERNKYYSVDLKRLNKIIGDENIDGINL